jgi:hypothetical protein
MIESISYSNAYHSTLHAITSPSASIQHRLFPRTNTRSSNSSLCTTQRFHAPTIFLPAKQKKNVETGEGLLQKGQPEHRYWQKAGRKLRIWRPNRAFQDCQKRCRLPAALVDNRRNVVLQVNTQAKATPLKSWLRKNSSHGKLATASFDTAAKDQKAETARVLAELEKKAKDNL